MSVATPAVTPKHQMLGQTLKSGWSIIRQLPRSPDATGGHFGVGYLAQRGAEMAFLKAVDFVEALNAAEPMEAMRMLTDNALFEKDVLEYCAERGMSRVMRYLGHEYVDMAGNPVSCLIMEIGDKDLRGLLSNAVVPTCAWTLKVISDVALALAQLHRGGIAHQDLKPSNVISVNDEKTGDQMLKVGDLGRVIRRDQKGPFDGIDWSGDLGYCPPEQWYGHIPLNWNDRRESADVYMLGSLLMFLCTGTTLQTLIYPKIPTQYRPDAWGGNYDDDLMQVLMDANAKVLHHYLKPMLMNEIADELMKIVQELTHPDPLQRGDSRARRSIGRPVGVDRIQQRLYGLYLRAAAIEKGRGVR